MWINVVFNACSLKLALNQNIYSIVLILFVLCKNKPLKRLGVAMIRFVIVSHLTLQCKRMLSLQNASDTFVRRKFVYVFK